MRLDAGQQIYIFFPFLCKNIHVYYHVPFISNNTECYQTFLSFLQLSLHFKVFKALCEA